MRDRHVGSPSDPVFSRDLPQGGSYRNGSNSLDSAPAPSPAHDSCTCIIIPSNDYTLLTCAMVLRVGVAVTQSHLMSGCLYKRGRSLARLGREWAPLLLQELCGWLEWQLSRLSHPSLTSGLLRDRAAALGESRSGLTSYPLGFDGHPLRTVAVVGEQSLAAGHFPSQVGPARKCSTRRRSGRGAGASLLL